MTQVTTAGPPRLIDVRLELLHRSGDSWLVADDGQLPLGDRVALRCTNRGDREVSGAVCMRTMTRRLRAVSEHVQDLWPGQSVEFGTSPHEQFIFTEQDVEIVLLASPYEAAVEEMLQTLRDDTAAPDELTLLAVELRGKPSELPISDDDLIPLLSVARGGQFESGAQALRALTLLQPSDSVTEALSLVIRDQLRLPQLLHRPWLISVAANLADEGLRQHLRGIAADSIDPHSRAAQQALSEVGDAEALPTVSALLHGTDEEAQRAARILATRYPDFDASQLRAEELPSGPRAFWTALASARQGSFAALREHTTAIDNAGFKRLLGDAATTYYAARDMIPISVNMRRQLYEARSAHGLPSSVIEFYDLLLSEPDVTALPDGMRTVPDYCVAEIRQQLGAIPGVTDLGSYISEKRTEVWERADGLSPAHRGVLLSELLKSAVAQSTQPLAAAAVDLLVRRWNYQQPWYPNISGLLEVLRDLGATPLNEARLGIELQVGWLLSRAPVTQLLRLVNNRIRAGESVETDVRLLSNAIVTHWDPIPPPPTAEVTRVPQMIQRISAIRPLPTRRTRALLTDKQFSMGRWTATMAISIGETDNAQGGADPRDAAVPGNHLEAASQLIVLPHADGGTITPASQEVRFPGPRETVNVSFDVDSERDSLQLVISIYQRQPTTLLQELTGVIQFSANPEGL
jgi:hypothetical protein